MKFVRKKKSSIYEYISSSSYSVNFGCDPDMFMNNVIAPRGLRSISSTRWEFVIIYQFFGSQSMFYTNTKNLLLVPSLCSMLCLIINECAKN